MHKKQNLSHKSTKKVQNKVSNVLSSCFIINEAK